MLQLVGTCLLPKPVSWESTKRTTYARFAEAEFVLATLVLINSIRNMSQGDIDSSLERIIFLSGSKL
jgi:hypothetical protein